VLSLLTVAILTFQNYFRLEFNETLGLNTAKTLGNCLLVLHGLVYAAPDGNIPNMGSILCFLGVPEIMIAISWLLGSSTLVVMLACVLRYISKSAALTKDVADLSKSVVRLSQRALLLHLRFLVSLPVTICLVTGLVFPPSETASGGNYNLHNLPATFRREIRPDASYLFSHGELESSVRPRTSSQYHLVPGVPVTLYLPSAGFLWTDNMIWDDTAQAFDEDYKIAPLDEKMIASGKFPKQNHRVVFQDRINTVSTSLHHPVSPCSRFAHKDQIRG
jgi:hypothetical protein